MSRGNHQHLLGADHVPTPAFPQNQALVVKDNTQEGIIDADLAVVLDEAQFSEFVHEKIDPGPRCANHLCQHLLR